MSEAGAALVSVLVTLGAVVVLPLGLRLLGPGAVPAPRSAWWPVAGACGAASLWLPRGGPAVVLAGAFAGAAAVLLGSAVRYAARAARARWARASPGAPLGAPLGVVVATATALAMPAVGASALVAERAGWGLLGFSGTYLALTVPHMLYAGFGAALVAGLVAGLRLRGRAGRLATAGAWGVPIGTVLVLVGYLVGDVAELAGAVVLTGALWATAAATARVGAVRDGAVARRARLLLGVGVVTIVASMLLALWWAVGEAIGLAHPDLDTMAATHGVANALGYVLCTLLGVRLVAVPDLATTSEEQP